MTPLCTISYVKTFLMKTILLKLGNFETTSFSWQGYVGHGYASETMA